MRTENEKLMIPIAEDLIEIVSLSKIYASCTGMQLNEACDFVTEAIVGCDELIEVYRTDMPGLPVCIGEVNSKDDFKHVLEALRMPFRSRWWENPASLTVIQAGWSGTLESVAVRRDDAERLLEIDIKGQVPVEATPVSEKHMAKRGRDTLLKLIIGMAIKGYTHNPTASKSTAPKEIADDLTKLGMTITDDTVRKYLKQAVDTVLPANWRQT